MHAAVVRPALLAATLAATAALAGCVGGRGGAGDGPAGDPSLGTARIVVLDDAIRPLEGAEVRLARVGAEAAVVNVTGADGVAVIAGLEPGAYVAEARKAGFDVATVALTVTAGEEEPPFVKMQLALQAGGLPFYNEFKFDGFMEASASIGNWGGIANFYPCYVEQQAGQQCTGNLTNDVSIVEVQSVYDAQRIPDWIQVEMVWETNQAASTYLTTRIDASPPDTFLIDNSTSKTGPSPLLVIYPVKYYTDWGLGVNHTMALEAFHGGPAPVCDSPAQENCQIVGAAAQQRYSWYVHIFYGYTPPEGWRFTADGPPPPPA